MKMWMKNYGTGECMTGLERRRVELLDEKGRIFLAAFDHPQIYGVMEGLEKPVEAIQSIISTAVDGFILNPGVFGLVDAILVRNKKMVLRASLGGTLMANSFPDVHSVMVSPKQALSLGADAVLVMLVLGGDHDKESMTEVATAVDRFHDYSMPVMVEVLSADFAGNNDPDFVKHGARIAAELGADIVKAFYCDHFKAVTEGCPVPVVLAGGPKDADIMTVAKSVLEDGAAGFAFGRNIFQNENPTALIEGLNALLRG